MNEGQDYTFVNLKPIQLGLSGSEFDADSGPDLVHERIPLWLTYTVSSNILYTLNCWKRATPDTLGAVIYIPLHWVPAPDRWKYRDAQLFGHPLRLNEYTSEAQVAVVCREKPKR